MKRTNSLFSHLLIVFALFTSLLVFGESDESNFQVRQKNCDNNAKVVSNYLDDEISCNFSRDSDNQYSFNSENLVEQKINDAAGKLKYLANNDFQYWF